MDDMEYFYITDPSTGLRTNKLDRVDDAVTSATPAYYDDIKSGESTGNYVYDAIGNLIQDACRGSGYTGMRMVVSTRS